MGRKKQKRSKPKAPVKQTKKRASKARDPLETNSNASSIDFHANLLNFCDGDEAKSQVTIKAEPLSELSTDEDEPLLKKRKVAPVPKNPRKSKRVEAQSREENKDEAAVPSSSEQIKKPGRKKKSTAEKTEKKEKSSAENVKKPTKKKRTYECFLCREKFLGLSVFDNHKCTVDKYKCEVSGCELYFPNQNGYNNHIFHRHGLPRVSSRHCPACKTNYIMNAIQFDRHCRQCTKDKDFKDKKIKCKECNMVCDNIRSYAAHRMIHETKNLKKSVIDENGVLSVPRKPKYTKNEVCDLCGKSFDPPGLQKHKSNVHLVNFTGEMFYCNICPIAKPTMALLRNHIRRSHVVKEHPCEICGKVFKNRDTWKKHQLVHTNSKDENRCEICPRAPGFLTKTDLKKHMAQNHDGEQPDRKFFCDVCGQGYSRDDQLIRHKAHVHQLTENTYTEEIINQYLMK